MLKNLPGSAFFFILIVLLISPLLISGCYGHVPGKTWDDYAYNDYEPGLVSWQREIEEQLLEQQLRAAEEDMRRQAEFLAE